MSRHQLGLLAAISLSCCGCSLAPQSSGAQQPPAGPAPIVMRVLGLQYQAVQNYLWNTSDDAYLGGKGALCVSGAYGASLKAVLEGDYQQPYPTSYELLRSPEVWCWLVDDGGDAVPLERDTPTAGSLGLRGPDVDDIQLPTQLLQIRRNSGSPPFVLLEDQPQWISWGRQFQIDAVELATEYEAGITEREEVGRTFLGPLSTFNLGSRKLPNDYSDAMHDLRLRPIDGRLAALNARYGPIEIRRHPELQMFDLYIGSGESEVILRWELDTRMGKTRRVLATELLDPPLSALQPWATIAEDALGPDVAFPIESLEGIEADPPRKFPRRP